MVQLKDLSVALKNNTMDPNDVKITRLSHAESQRRRPPPASSKKSGSKIGARIRPVRIPRATLLIRYTG